MKEVSNKKFYPYLYILPSFIILGFVYFYPIIQILINSFYRFSGGERVFVGFGNYIYLLLKDELTHRAILNNLKVLLTIPILLALSIFFAVIFFEKLKGTKLFQAIFFIPLVISIVVVAVVFSYLLRVDGILNFILKQIGLGILAKNWLGDPTFALFAVMVVIIWKELAFGIILFLARLSSVNESIFEAAKIDGANWFQTLIYITIPQLRIVIDFYIVYYIMIMFAWIFTYVFVMTSGGPANSTMILELQIFKYAFERNSMGMASALSIILFLFILIFIYLQARFRRGSLGD